MALQRMEVELTENDHSSAQVDLTEEDPFKVLGLGLQATEDDIKKAYKQLSLQCHPDKHPEDASATARFQHISDAYQLLLDADFKEICRLGLRKVPSICNALQKYTLRPQAAAFIDVYSGVFDITESKAGHVKLEELLCSQVSHSMGRFAECLRQPCHEPHSTFMKNAISEMYRVRNRLYCLQAAFACGGKSKGFPSSFSRAFSGAREDEGIDVLAQGFWRSVIEAVEQTDDCAMLLPDLVRVWCRIGSTTIGLRVPALPTDSHVYDAMRAAFAARNAKLLSPCLTIRSSKITCVLHIQNKSLITMAAAFLTDEDLHKFYCLHRWSSTKSSVLRLSSSSTSHSK